MKKGQKRLVNSVIGSVLVGAILVVLNGLALDHSFRIDLTKNQVYSLSQESKDLAKQLQEPLTVKAYFSKNLPPAYEVIRRDVEDMLQEYERYFGNKFEYQFLEPETPEVAQEAQSLGIPPVQFESVASDEYSVKEGYAGLVFLYEDSSEVIPIVTSMNRMEYEISSIIYRLSVEQLPVVTILQGEGIEPAQERMQTFLTNLNQLYTIEFHDYATGPVPEDTTILMVPGGAALGADALYVIDQAFMKGAELMVLNDTVSVDTGTLQARPQASGLEDLLSFYGVTPGTGLIADKQSGQIQIQQQQGNMRMIRMIQYPLLPIFQSRGEHPSVEMISGIQVPFVSPLSTAEKEGRSFETLFTSNPQSWVVENPAQANPSNPVEVNTQTIGANPIAVLGEGEFLSYFENREVPSDENGEDLVDQSQTTVKNPDGRLIVLGTSKIIDERFPIRGENLNLVLNMVDYLALTEGLGNIRSKDIVVSQLRDLPASARTIVKGLNIGGVSVLVIVFASLYLTIRRRRSNRMYVTSSK